MQVKLIKVAMKPNIKDYTFNIFTWMINKNILFHYCALFFKFHIVKVGFPKCKSLLKFTFHNVTFVSSMCQVWFNMEKVYFFSIPYFNIQWSLYFNLIHIYFIRFNNERILLNTVLTIQFQNYLFFSYIIQFFSRTCNQCTLNSM
jgi:hypothetical protein